MPTFAPEVWVRFARGLFQAAGTPDDEADRVARSLVDANLCGHDSHGLIRIPQYLGAIADGRLKPGAAFTVLKQTAALLVVDGGWGLGQVQAHRLLERLIPRSQALGIAAGTLKHCGHIGRLGEYAEVATAHQMAFFASVNNHGFGRGAAPPGGIEPRIGTNPLCLAVPTNQEPAILDIGTTVVAEGKVRVLYNQGARVPEGWLLDAQGKPTTDPAVLYTDPRGTIQPLGGNQAYKGFGIGLLLDMFCGGLSGAPCSRPGLPLLGLNAVFFLALDVEQFAGAGHFLREVTDLAAAVRDCPRAEGVAEVLTPGDPERRSKARRLRDGIPLDDGTWGQLRAAAERSGVAVPSL